MAEIYLKFTGETWQGLAGHVYDVVEIYQLPDGAGQGLGGTDWEALIAQGVQLGVGLYASNQQQGQQASSIQQQFDAYAVEVNSLFHAIQTKQPGTVTQEDVALAEQAYAALSEAVKQNPSLAPLWNSSAYDGAYQNGLNNIRRLAASATTSGAITTPSGNGNILTGGSTPTVEGGIAGIPIWGIAAMGIAAFALIKK